MSCVRGIRGGARSHLEALLRSSCALQGHRTAEQSVRFQPLGLPQATPRRPVPTPRAQSIVAEGSARMTGDLATATLMSNVSKLEKVVVEVHAEYLRNVHEGRSQDEVQIKVRDLPAVIQGLQQEYLELTARLTRPSALLAEAPGGSQRHLGPSTPSSSSCTSPRPARRTSGL